MKITCISASNTKNVGENSTSTKVCRLIEDIVDKSGYEELSVDIIRMMDHELEPCIYCGGCLEKNACLYDKSFNSLYSKLIDSDGIFFVIPHYTCIPSKLTMLFEKLNELFYVNWYNNSSYNFPLSGLPIGVIAHGGSPDQAEALKHFKTVLLDPVAYILKSLSLEVIGVDEQWENGVAFGLKDDNCINRVDGSLLPSIKQDWTLIEDRITPLVVKVLETVKNNLQAL